MRPSSSRSLPVVPPSPGPGGSGERRTRSPREPSTPSTRPKEAITIDTSISSRGTTASTTRVPSSPRVHRTPSGRSKTAPSPGGRSRKELAAALGDHFRDGGGIIDSVDLESRSANATPAVVKVKSQAAVARSGSGSKTHKPPLRSKSRNESQDLEGEICAILESPLQKSNTNIGGGFGVERRAPPGRTRSDIFDKSPPNSPKSSGRRAPPGRSKSGSMIDMILQSKAAAAFTAEEATTDNTAGEMDNSQRSARSSRSRARINRSKSHSQSHSQAHSEPSDGAASATAETGEREGRSMKPSKHRSSSSKSRSRSRSKSAKRRPTGRRRIPPNLAGGDADTASVSTENDTTASMSNSSRSLPFLNEVQVRNKPRRSGRRPQKQSSAGSTATTSSTETAEARRKEMLRKLNKAMVDEENIDGGDNVHHGLSEFLMDAAKKSPVKVRSGASRSVGGCPNDIAVDPNFYAEQAKVMRKLRSGTKPSLAASPSSKGAEEEKDVVAKPRIMRQSGGRTGLIEVDSEEDDQEDGKGELEEKSIHVSDLMGPDPPKTTESPRGRVALRRQSAKRGQQHLGGSRNSIAEDSDNTSDHSNVSIDLAKSNEPKESNAHYRMGMSMPQLMASQALDVGTIVAKNKMRRRRSRERGDALVLPEEDIFAPPPEEKEEEDIFTFYTWSTSRQPRENIEKERQRLRDSVRDDVMRSAYENFMKVYA
jgi:hypothetical protein